MPLSSAVVSALIFAVRAVWSFDSVFSATALVLLHLRSAMILVRSALLAVVKAVRSACTAAPAVVMAEVSAAREADVAVKRVRLSSGWMKRDIGSPSQKIW